MRLVLDLMCYSAVEISTFHAVFQYGRFYTPSDGISWNLCHIWILFTQIASIWLQEKVSVLKSFTRAAMHYGIGQKGKRIAVSLDIQHGCHLGF